MKNRLEYNVDIVFCIDVTGSMGPLLETVKENALSFYNDLMNEMMQKGKNIDVIRARVVAFRDYLADGGNAMLITDFYDLKEQSDMFDKVIRSLHPEGGGDEPEDALEALAYAIKSKWTTGGDKRRHLIVVWSDASTHEIGFSSSSASYPKNMVKSFDELTNLWDGESESGGCMDSNSKRLLIFAPEAEYWTTIADTWDNVIHFPSTAGNGLDRLSYREILSQIINSIA
ncbi:vWA domain-containing protein [Succinimonas sp.]|uniref:vWA domain-containing protein n=1 Tax=Succinimonas sp. TaxID=1936151 RepID=UPI003866C678